ncbi:MULTISPECIES: hypothetical protein [Sorangium]|uniref:hypothetical protein n=1 Tax=Sorangium TaxID=39643 RepID=UPI003D9C3CF1
MTSWDLDERAREALAAAWASRRPGRARQVLLAAPVGEAIAADVARLPGARSAGGVSVAVVSAEYAAATLDVMFGFRGDELREADPARVLVVRLGDEEAAVGHLDEGRGGTEQGAGEEEPMARSTSATAAPAPEEIEADTGARELRAEVLEVFEEAQGHAHEDAMEAWAARRRARGGKRLTERKGRAMATTKKTITPAATPQIQAAPAPEKPAKKKRKRERGPRPFDGMYGGHTRVTVEHTQRQIRALLKEHGCPAKKVGEDDELNVALVIFRLGERFIRFQFPVPLASEFTHRCVNGQMWKLPEEHAQARAQQALRQRWRAAYLGIKGRLVLVESGIMTLESAFVAETVDPASGLTVAELIQHRQLLPALVAAPNRPRVVEGELEETAA